MSLRTILQLVVAVGIFGTVGNVFAYEASPGGSTSDPCTQVYFSAFTPPPFSVEKNNKEVAPKSEFSFLASKATASVIVKIKDEQVPVTKSAMNEGFLFKGKLPPSIKGSYIRLDIFAKGPNNCDTTTGWLLKVGN